MENTHTARRDTGPQGVETAAPAPSRPFELLAARAAARTLSVSERTLFTLTQRGDIRVVRIGRAVRYDPADLRRFIEEAKGGRPTSDQGLAKGGK